MTQLPVVVGGELQLNFDTIVKRLNAAEAAVVVLQAPTTVVSSLPSSPIDGQVIDYLADATNGVVWRLKYRAASASTYKWEFVGGAELVAGIDTFESRASATFGDLATGGPSLTVPLAGDYAIQFGVHTRHSANGYDAQVSFAAGAAAALVADSLTSYAGTTSGADIGNSKALLKTGVLAGDAIKLQYASVGAVSTGWRNRWLRVTPRRVG